MQMAGVVEGVEAPRTILGSAGGSQPGSGVVSAWELCSCPVLTGIRGPLGRSLYSPLSREGQVTCFARWPSQAEVGG